MSQLRFTSSGESHGPELNIIVEGVPANMPLQAEDINYDLKRRQGGYGRGGRMKIETDKVTFTGGLRHGRTFGGAPVAMKLINKDHQKWLNVMNPAQVDADDSDVNNQLEEKFISKVRPGHADLAGSFKYSSRDVRDILERSSARETTSRVAAGAVCKKLLSFLGINVFSHVLRVGEVSVEAELNKVLSNRTNGDFAALDKDFQATVDNSELRIYDRTKDQGLTQKIKDHIDEIRKRGDSLGGLIEVYATGVPIGLGSHVQWDQRLDAKIAQALMSVHTIKSVEIGMGRDVAISPGSQVHDQIYLKDSFDHNESLNKLKSLNELLDEAILMNHYNEGFNKIKPFAINADDFYRYSRQTNNLGGFEGGMTNGEPIVCRAALKPIPTLVSKLNSIDLSSQGSSKSHFERSDVCVVPAGGVVLEAMLAVAITEACLAKFGGDSIEDLMSNYLAYLKKISLR